MKAAGLLLFLFGTTVSAQSSLPECRGTDVSRWTNCQGTATYPNGRYIGEYRDGKPYGQGTYTFASGNKYVGEHRDGKPHGQGTATFANGDKYVGEYRDGMRHGQGTYTSARGDKYVGEYSYDKIHGQGTSTFANGDKYVGEYRDGMRNGQGTYTFARGDKYVGEHRDGKFHGQGTSTFANGNKYVGEFRDDKIHGQGIFTFADGRPPQEGIWADDKFARAERIPDHIAGRTSTPPLGSPPVHGDATQPSVQPSSRSKEYLARHILVEREADAKAIISRLTAGEKFDNFIHLSKDPGTSRQGGTLGWADAKTFVEPFASAMISLGKGQFTQTPVFTVFGWHVILLDDVRERESPVAKASRPVEAPRSITPLSLFASTSQPSPDGVVTLSITTNNATASLKINGDEEGGRADGRYSVRRFAPIGETRFEIQATDRFGNVQRQTVSVVREPADTTVRFSQLNPLNIRPRAPRDAVAIIIGIQDYRRVPKADFANNDARAFYDYAVRGLGIRGENIKMLLDQEADEVGILSALKNWLPLKVRKNQTEVFVFYSGHGLPSNDGSSLYLLPHGVDRQFLERTAINQAELIVALQAPQPRSVTMFLDACYSGQSRGGETLLASARPIVVQAKASSFPANFTVISASSAMELASSSPELKHGIFSYWLMKGIEGEADANKDGQITAIELREYISDAVGRMSAAQGRQQRPQAVGELDRVVVHR